MALDPRRIALQGLGYAAQFVALQGLLPVTTPVASEPPGVSVGYRGSAWLGFTVSHPRNTPSPADLVRRMREEELLVMLVIADLEELN